jgi:LCP family protein required for cell wall assembly
MSKRILLLLLASFAWLILAGCELQSLIASPLPQAGLGGVGEVRAFLVTVPPNATATATPFLPVQSTPIVAPTRQPTLQASAQIPTPTATELPLQGNYYRRPADQVNILLLGSDQRPGDPSFRTDTIILLTLNPGLGTATMTSFPRDLYLPIPGYTSNRINTVFGLGRFSLLQQTFEYNFGLRPDYYVMINLNGFTRTIDSLGGIDVEVGQTLTDHRDKIGRYTVQAGTVHMDGETALWYVRSRYTSSDFDRTRRQQEVVEAIFNRLMSLDAVRRAPELFSIYRDNVETNLSLDDLTPLLPLALKVHSTEQIQRFFIGTQHVSRYFVPTTGADVLLPIQSLVMDVIYQAAGVP